MPVVLSKEPECRHVEEIVSSSAPKEESSFGCETKGTCVNCPDCGEVIICPKCDDCESGGCRGGRVELRIRFSGEGRGYFHGPRSFRPSFGRGGFDRRGNWFYSPDQAPHRPPFGRSESGHHCGFGPQRLGAFPPRHDFLPSFGTRPDRGTMFNPSGNLPFDASEMHCYGFGPFRGRRGRACFARGGRGVGVVRGQGSYRGRGGRVMCGCPPRGKASGQSEVSRDARVCPEVVSESQQMHDPEFECSCQDPTVEYDLIGNGDQTES